MERLFLINSQYTLIKNKNILIINNNVLINRKYSSIIEIVENITVEI